MGEAELIDAFLQVIEQFGYTDASITTHANQALNDLGDHRLLNRFISSSVNSDALYRPTALGIGLTTDCNRQREFSALRLSLQRTTVAQKILQAVEAATAGDQG